MPVRPRRAIGDEDGPDAEYRPSSLPGQSIRARAADGIEPGRDGCRSGPKWSPSGGVHFRVWAPKHRAVEVVLQSGPGAGERSVSLEDDGYFCRHRPRTPPRGHAMPSGSAVPTAPSCPIPASRYQPEGRTVRPRWSILRPCTGPIDDWRGVESIEGRCSTSCTSARSRPRAPGRPPRAAPAPGRARRHRARGHARRRVPRRTSAGATTGSTSFAPFHGYGTPDDIRRFVDRAHALGLAVILDVVYNHLGPGGDYLKQFSDDFFSEAAQDRVGRGRSTSTARRAGRSASSSWRTSATGSTNSTSTACGSTPRRPSSTPVRSTSSARSPGGCARRPAIVACWSSARTSRSTPGWSAGAERGGLGFDMLWSDDFHHAATGRRHGPPRGVLRRLSRLAAGAGLGPEVGLALPGPVEPPPGEAARHARRWTSRPRRSSLISQNHDQVANSARGERLHELTTPGRLRALTALLLLGPATPMLFQGQEFAASSPFLYFATRSPEVAEAMHRGRKKFLAQFPSLATPEMQERLPHPGRRETFERSKLDPAERTRARTPRSLSLHRDLLRLRREDADDPRRSASRRVDGAVLGPEALVAALVRSGASRATTACCWSTWASSCTCRSPPNRCWPRPRAGAGGSSGRARTRATAAAARPNPRPRRRTGGWPPMPPS